MVVVVVLRGAWGHVHVHPTGQCLQQILLSLKPRTQYIGSEWPRLNRELLTYSVYPNQETANQIN